MFEGHSAYKPPFFDEANYQYLRLMENLAWAAEFKWNEEDLLLDEETEIENLCLMSTTKIPQVQIPQELPNNEVVPMNIDQSDNEIFDDMCIDDIVKDSLRIIVCGMTCVFPLRSLKLKRML